MLAILFSSAFPWLWLSGTDFGINHFITDLILVVSFAVLTALPMSFLRPVIKKWEQAGVKAFFFKSRFKILNDDFSFSKPHYFLWVILTD